jgi:hypothetical protein
MQRPNDRLSREVSTIDQIKARRQGLLIEAQRRQFETPPMLSLDQLLEKLDKAMPYLTSARFGGVMDGGRLGLEMSHHITLPDCHHIPGVDYGFPIATLITQSLREGLLVYRGHIEWTTAVGRVGIKVGTVTIGSTIGSTIGAVALSGLPGGVFLGGLLGGLIGGSVGQAVIEHEFRRAKDEYAEANEKWKTRLETFRAAATSRLSKSRFELQQWYFLSLSSVPNYGGYLVCRPLWKRRQAVVLRRKTTHLTTCGISRAVEWITRCLASTNIGIMIRDNFADRLAALNEHDLSATKHQAKWFGQLHAAGQSKIDREHETEMFGQTKLVTNMISELNEHYEAMRRSLKRLGRTA